jgi:hypothetical protein
VIAKVRPQDNSKYCWYARLTAPEEIQLTAVAFLLGSLFHIAKDYLDQAASADLKEPDNTVEDSDESSTGPGRGQPEKLTDTSGAN